MQIKSEAKLNANITAQANKHIQNYQKDPKTLKKARQSVKTSLHDQIAGEVTTSLNSQNRGELQPQWKKFILKDKLWYVTTSLKSKIK